MSVSPDALIQQLRSAPDSIRFDAVLATIAAHYTYTPCRFSNGLGDDRVVNPAGSNAGACRVFAFARLHGLSEAETLALFGDHYRKDVLAHPERTDHANIRSFMRHGWSGIAFDRPALAPH